jgi:hypothetical protein
MKLRYPIILAPISLRYRAGSNSNDMPVKYPKLNTIIDKTA